MVAMVAMVAMVVMVVMVVMLVIAVMVVDYYYDYDYYCSFYCTCYDAVITAGGRLPQTQNPEIPVADLPPCTSAHARPTDAVLKPRAQHEDPTLSGSSFQLQETKLGAGEGVKVSK